MRHSQVRLYGETIALSWMKRFLQERVKVSDYTSRNVAAVHAGPRKLFELCREPIKLFYTIENVHVPYSAWCESEDLFLNDKSLSLSIGFDYLDHPKYIRFPYWLMAHFSPLASYNDIKTWCQNIDNQCVGRIGGGESAAGLLYVERIILVIERILRRWLIRFCH